MRQMPEEVLPQLVGAEGISRAVEDMKTMIVKTIHVCSIRKCKFNIKPFINKGG
jgi:hypothetical protein